MDQAGEKRMGLLKAFIPFFPQTRTFVSFSMLISTQLLQVRDS